MQPTKMGHTGQHSLVLALMVTVLLSFVATVTYASEQKRDLGAPERISLQGVVVGQEVVYPNGVMVSLKAGTGLASADLDVDSASPMAVIACSTGYTCIYEHANYGGRRLQWRDRGQLINLTDYGFNDQMSSWRNLNSVDARWFYNVNSSGTTRCMNANSSAAWVGSGDNDKASSLRIYTDGRAC